MRDIVLIMVAAMIESRLFWGLIMTGYGVHSTEYGAHFTNLHTLSHAATRTDGEAWLDAGNGLVEMTCLADCYPFRGLCSKIWRGRFLMSYGG